VQNTRPLPMKANSKKMLLINLSIKFGIRHWLKKFVIKEYLARFKQTTTAYSRR
jgi:hypothetical protein